jgi:predicted anti-sigma-YlaC factor YlaD
MNTENCKSVREGLTEYLELALSPERRQGFERHLLECEECCQLHVDILLLNSLTSGSGEETMPSAMKSRLVEAFRRDPRRA